MKKSAFLIFAFLTFVFGFMSCRGPEGLPGPKGDTGAQGPQGPQGPAGSGGGGLIAQAFDVQADFTAEGKYQAYVDMPENLEVLESDVVLVFLAWETQKVGGKDATVWKPLPHLIPVSNGFFQYNYDYTQYDVQFYLNGSIDLATLPDTDTKKQIFRVVVVPADILANGRKAAVDLKNYEEVAAAYGLNSQTIQKLMMK